MRALLTLSVLLAFGPVAIAADERPEQTEDEKAIRQTGKTYVEAFNRGDARAIAALWTVDGELVNDLGQTFHGREAIEKEFAAVFARNLNLKIETSVESIRFLAPDVAAEEGVTRLAGEETGPLATSRYSVVHVKRDGQWLAARVRDSLVETTSNFPFLIELDWLVGRWVARSDEVAVHTECEWAANKNFLRRTHRIEGLEGIAPSGVQIIGWDPTSGRVVSWSFDSDGGHGYGTWQRSETGWTIHSVGVLRDGTPTSSTNVITIVDEDTFTWKSVDRMAGGEALADAEEVVLDRAAPGKTPPEDAVEVDRPDPKPTDESKP